MKNRPLVFIVLALMHFCEPLIKILYFKLNTGLELERILSNVFQMGSPFKMMEFWLLFPIAGLALITVKKWGYPVFVGIQAYSIFQHLTYDSYTWPYVAKNPHFYSLFILSFNIGVVLYFLLPDVRMIFFDKRMRWWENRIRYNFPLRVHFSKGDPNKLYQAEALNISQSGIFMAYASRLIEVGDLIHVKIEFAGESLTLNGNVVSRHEFESNPGVGVQFNYENIWEKLAMARIIRRIASETKKKAKEERISEHRQAA